MTTNVSDKRCMRVESQWKRAGSTRSDDDDVEERSQSRVVPTGSTRYLFGHAWISCVNHDAYPQACVR